MNEEFGLEWLDFGFRWYDPAIGRFPSVDPIAEDFAHVSPFNYAENEPIGSIDLWGLQRVKVSSLADKVIGNDQKGIITTATPEQRDRQPLRAGIKDGSYAVLNLMGLNYVDNAIATANDPNSSITDVVEEASPLMSPGGKKGGKASGSTKSFNNKSSTNSTTSREAFRKAKDANGIPRSQQPDKTIKPNTAGGDAAGLDSRNVKQQEFTNSYGDKVTIRKDKSAVYPDGGKQGPHYNAGNTGGKLKQHHNYKAKHQ